MPNTILIIFASIAGVIFFILWLLLFIWILRGLNIVFKSHKETYIKTKRENKKYEIEKIAIEVNNKNKSEKNKN